VGSPGQSQHSRGSPYHANSSVAPCCSAVSGSHSSSAAFADSAQGCWEQSSWGSCWHSDQPPHTGSSCCSRECEVHWASRACQPESSDISASMQGVESVASGAGTAERSAETAGAAVAGTSTAAAGHNPCRASWTKRSSQR
jgi:hypothetical protein